eukprot:12936856-Prorocentrum_lima.AAC.1
MDDTFPPSVSEDQIRPTTEDIEGRIGRVKPTMAIYAASWKNPQGEFDDSCSLETELLSGRPFFAP